MYSMRNYISTIAVILALPFCVHAQKHPQGYFRNPLNIPIMLAGNFGECRSNHFHSGLDIKTEGRENLPVHAAADGYVSRVRIQNGGFGHVLYLTHPNGYSTVYAHLNDFAPAIQEYMRAEQYKRKSWTVDLYTPASMFPVKKGDLIAYSGNTGGSLAPHLHFEIRDSKTESPVNPALFGFDISDHVAPKPTELLIYDLQRSIYSQTAQSVPLAGKGNNYKAKSDTIIVSSPLVGIAFKANDYMENSTNTLTYYIAELKMDDTVQGKITLDNISYNITRYMNAFVDYSKKSSGWIQCLFRMPGNHLSTIYDMNKMRGALNISDGKPHPIVITLIDAFGNASTINTFIKYNGAQHVPDNCEELFRVNKPNSFTHPNIRFTLDSKALYDDICFTFTEKADMNAYSARYKISENNIPVHTYYSLYIKPNKPIPFELRDKVVMIINEGNKESGRAAVYDNGWYRASVRSFGEYRLMTDTEPPALIPMQSREALLKSSRITFKASEKLTSVDKFYATIDGKWVPFEQSGDVFFYTFDDSCPKGDHELVITAADESGNEETIKYSFKR